MTGTVTWTDRSVERGDVRLHAREAGDPADPTVVLVHGYPDTSAVWGAVAERLAGDHHVVVYDTRGMGRSSEPTGPRPYAIEHLARDLVAVIDATSPDRPAHVAGHDWGSIQGWEAVVDPAHQQRIASYTSISGPCLDHIAHRMRAMGRSRRPADLRRAAAQALRSSYIAFFRLPLLPTAAWSAGADRGFRRFLARQGVPVDATNPAATLASDGRRGIELYRANMGRRLRRPQPRPTDVPVQLLVLDRDPYVTGVLLEGVEDWCSDLTRTHLDAGHWAPCTHPDEVAARIADHVATVEARTG
jgi:pimeloyl-ACP methyl ester carboxylesterase